MSDSLLSILAVRAGEISESIFGSEKQEPEVNRVMHSFMDGVDGVDALEENAVVSV